jgi:ribosomal-protein-alanine N-acetyltransferase
MMNQDRDIGEKEPILTTPRLIVRMADYRDVPAIVDYYSVNKAFLKPYEPTRSPSFFSRTFWQMQVEQNRLQFRQDTALRLFIFEQADSEVVIGAINFSQFFREPFHSCVVGYSLAEAKQNNGFMREALATAIDYQFKEQNFHRIMANYMPRNQRSGNLLRRLGFVVEGYARDYLQINGNWEDHILTSAINPHWRSHYL